MTDDLLDAARRGFKWVQRAYYSPAQDDERLEDYHAIENAIAAAERADGGGWRPIATAPKDGTPVVLFDPVYQTHIGSWACEYIDAAYGDARILQPARWCIWSNRLNDKVAPTYWQPLPPPPQEQEPGDG